MPPSSVPKYQAIYAVLRQQILKGEFAPGSQLPPQQELADRFGVTLMTLRQALASLESDGLVRAARGKGTFVADRPIDISVGNLSSFSAQMKRAGVDLGTEVVGFEAVVHPEASAALDDPGELIRITRIRRVAGLPISLQRSYVSAAVSVSKTSLDSASLYDSIESATGWVVAEAAETISAVLLSEADAAALDADPGSPALRSVRTSINQYGHPFLYDEAFLVGGRCSIAANRSSDRLSITYGHDPQ
ncbi:MAG: GntR family transcriptional regulator [Acidimicrobiia bacterium]|nr:GntR family transcriptional regulator [Acidimicrobiia bacterium]